MRRTLLIASILSLVLLGVTVAAEAAPTVWSGPGDVTASQVRNSSQFWLAKPANTVEGDLLVAQIVYRLDYSSPWIDTPNGWRRLSVSRYLDLHEMATFVRRAGPDEPSQYMFSATGYETGFLDWCGAIIRYTGAHDAYGSSINMGAGGEMLAPDINVPAGTVIQAVYAMKYGTSMAPTDAGMTVRYHYYAHMPQMGILASTQERIGGLTGSRIATGSGDYWLAEMIAVHPEGVSAPVVVVNPVDQTVTYGQDAQFYAAVNGVVAPWPAIQWQVSADDGLTWADVAGETSTRMTITRPPVAWDGYLYRCIFDNGFGDPAASSPARLTVNRKALTVAALDRSKLYDGQVFPYDGFEFGCSGFITGEDGGVLSGSVTYSGDAVAAFDAGTYRIGLSGDLAAANYSVTYADGWLTINRRPVTVTADAKSKVYGEPDPELTYQLTSGSLLEGDAFSGAMARAAGENTGSYTIGQGTLTLGDNYAVTFVPAYLTVEQRPLTVAADGKNKPYGDADPALTWQISSGDLVGSDRIWISLRRVAGEEPGQYQISNTYFYVSPGNNYALTYIPANLTIEPRPVTITAQAKAKAYGDPDPALTYQITSGSLVSADTFTGTLIRQPGDNVGSYEIQQGTVALNSNYRLTYVPGILTVSPRPVTVTADAKAKDYGEVDPALTYRITSGSVVSQDEFTGALTRDAGESAGTYPIRQGDLALSSNYALSYVGADLTISLRSITIAADPAAKVYGDADPPFTYHIASGSLLPSDGFSGALTRSAGEGTGSYSIQQGTVAIDDNYAITFVSANLTISPKPVTVSADAAGKTYGDLDPPLTYTITSGSLAFTDGFSGALGRAAGEAVGTYPISQGSLALSANYTLSYAPASLTISPRPVTIAADSKIKAYGDSDPDLTYQVMSGNLAFADAFTGALAREEGEAPGEYTIGQGSVALGPNYQLSYVPGTLTIARRVVTVAADAKSKTYGDSDPALTYQIIGGSLVSPADLTGELAREAGEDAGSYSINQGTLALGDHYTLTYVPAALTITARPVTVAADPGLSKIYGDSDPEFTYRITAGSIAFADTFTGALSREAGVNVGVYEILQGTLTLGDNYAVTYVPADFTITPRSICIAAEPKTKTYGEDDPPLTYQITSGSVVPGDVISGSPSREGGEDVGTYCIARGDIDINSNYDLRFEPAALSIVPRPVTVTADAKTKIYGQSDPDLTYHIADGSLSFSDGFTGTLTRETGEAVGRYEIRQGSLALSANYKLTYVAAQLTIMHRQVVVVADAQTKLYGEDDPILTYRVASGSLVTGDDFTGTLARDPGEKPGIYAIRLGTLALPADYDLQYGGDSLSIHYGMTGLLAPFDNAEGVSKVGAVLPLRWRYTDFQGAVVPSSTANPAITISLVGGPELRPVATPGKTGLRYEAKELMWVFNWSTKKLDPGVYRICITSNETGQVEQFEVRLIP